jgi:hypothetical protein
LHERKKEEGLVFPFLGKMPKKGKKEEPPPEPEPEEPEPEEPHEPDPQDVADCMELVTQMADDVVVEKERTETSFGVAVAAALSESMAVVEHRFLQHDAGSSDSVQEGPTWRCDEEPLPSAMDTWARGSVPIKVRPKLAVEEMQDVDEGSFPAGMNTSRSLRSTRSIGSRKSRSRASASSTGTDKEEILVAHSKPQPRRGTNSQDEQARRTMKERTDKEERVARIETSYNEERGKIASVLQELKGTEYGYNHKGEIIMLESVNTERLPSESVHLRVGLWSEAPDEEGAQPRRRNRRQNKAGRGEVPSSAADVGSVVSAGAMQGPVMESINMESGVVLRSGESEKRGPPSKKDPMRMSRKDYDRLLSGTGMIEDVMMETAKTAATAEGEEGPGLEEEDDDEPDWMADARPATPMEEPESELPEALANHIEFNQSILGAADWGQAGAPAVYRPQMPPSKEALQAQQTAAIGHLAKPPRERPYDKVPGIPTSQQMRLPAPIYPAAKGHGFQLGYLGGDKSFVEASQQASFTEASPRLEGEGSSASVGLPPIAGAQASFSSQGAHNRSGGKKRRSFNRYPPSHVHNANPALSRRYLGVR